MMIYVTPVIFWCHGSETPTSLWRCADDRMLAFLWTLGIFMQRPPLDFLGMDRLSIWLLFHWFWCTVDVALLWHMLLVDYLNRSVPLENFFLLSNQNLLPCSFSPLLSVLLSGPKTLISNLDFASSSAVIQTEHFYNFSFLLTSQVVHLLIVIRAVCLKLCYKIGATIFSSVSVMSP